MINRVSALIGLVVFAIALPIVWLFGMAWVPTLALAAIYGAGAFVVTGLDRR